MGSLKGTRKVQMLETLLFVWLQNMSESAPAHGYNELQVEKSTHSLPLREIGLGAVLKEFEARQWAP
jgi:hypothetical protein